MNSKAPYKDFEVDIDKGIDMFSNMSKCLDKKWECDANKRCNEECDECKYMYGCGNTGQIQNLLENVQEWLTELKKYKQMEERGSLIKLPCKIGDTVYCIASRYTKCTFYNEEFDEYSCQGCEYECNSKKENYVQDMRAYSFDWIIKNLNNFGKTVFLTKSEAEAKLKELRGVENGSME